MVERSARLAISRRCFRRASSRSRSKDEGRRRAACHSPAASSASFARARRSSGSRVEAPLSSSRVISCVACVKWFPGPDIWRSLIDATALVRSNCTLPASRTLVAPPPIDRLWVRVPPRCASPGPAAGRRSVSDRDTSLDDVPTAGTLRPLASPRKVHIVLALRVVVVSLRGRSRSAEPSVEPRVVMDARNHLGVRRRI